MNTITSNAGGYGAARIRKFLSTLTILAIFLLGSIPILQAQEACGFGCTFPDACNYDPLAAFDDGSCIFGDCSIAANNDVICIDEDDTVSVNVLANDVFPAGMSFFLQIMSDDPCFYIDPEGNIFQNPDSEQDCCGEHRLSYSFCLEDGSVCDQAEVCITVKCGKPDCTIANLEDYIQEDGTIDPLDPNGGPPCISVCENSETTVFFPYNPLHAYIWNVFGGVESPGANDAEKTITWGPSGSGSINLIIDTPLGPVVHNFCVDILEGPKADFDSDTYVCLGQTLCFDNTSINADVYNWDFGDGTFSTMEAPCQPFTTPGTQTVTLTATKFNYDAEGNPLCCCTDTYSVEIEVDSLPGPSIFWISTLCEGDSSKYWTDATNCSNYSWTVLDENGVGFPFLGQGNDTICVTWPAGNAFGEIILEVDDCDSTYCDNPTSAIVPIIPLTTDITGPIVVCENSTEVYTLPKWMTTTYQWDVTGGVVLSGDGSHQATIQWGPAGVGTIHVDYFSTFLSGLPGHDDPDCTGSADLIVNILPEFDVVNFGPNVVCIGESSSISATNIPSTDYNWTISPSVPFSGQGTETINVNWSSGGTYVISATPNDPNAYCNSTQTTVVQVMDIEPAIGIDGPIDICLNEPYFYSAVTASSGVNFNWSITGGTLSSPIGPAVEVTWTDPVGPYILTLTQQMQTAPFCSSPPISIMPVEKVLVDPIVILPGDSCKNILTNFSAGPPQHAHATYLWTISPAIGGSIASGQGTPNIQVQWNNAAIPVTVSVEVSLCENTLIKDFDLNLYAPIEPVITQIGIMCPGVDATLDAGPGFIDYLWNNLDVTQSTLTSGEGMYSVTTRDINNCEATAYYQASDVPGPPAYISSGQARLICIDTPHTVSMTTPYYAGLTYEWFCNNVSQGPPTTNPNFDHPFAGVPGSFSYEVEVVDTNTGCITTSLPFLVTEDFCNGGCDGEPYTLSPIVIGQFPECNMVDFSYSASPNFTFSNWSFGDGNFSGVPTTTHSYTEAGCYNVRVSGLVPEVGTANFCSVSADRSICVPLAADFDIEYLDCTSVQFTDFSSIIAGPGNDIDTYFWQFGAGTSAAINPSFTFPNVPGTYPVTLTVTNDSGCIATITKNVIISTVGVPAISIPPAPYCVGVPINLSASAVNAVSYLWDFGDGSSYMGASPVKTYTADGNYTISVTATSSNGCEETTSINITVNPAIPPATIAGDLNVCEGATTLLTAPPGYTYLWSNFMVSQSINVVPGAYSVTLTDAFGCMLTLEEVTVVEIPSPIVVISGNPIICDNNCTLLSVPFTPGYDYRWLDNTNTVVGTSSVLNVCSGSIASPYTLVVTDENDCTGTSDPFDVIQATSPSFTLLVSPDNCAGTPSTLTVSPVEPDVAYTWSNGMTGTSITVSAAGTYTAYGTNTITGCSSSASAVINPQPDLCYVPAGCYEVCDPYEVCGPDGMATYQWNMNGMPILGETMQCLTVTQSGSYNLTAFNDYGCFTTSDSLYLMVINCDPDPCEDLSVDYSYLMNADQEIDSCCFSLSYLNDAGIPIQGVTIRTNDADLSVDVPSIDPSLQVQSLLSNSLSLISDPSGNPIPTGSLNNFVDICLANVVNDPQQVIIDWYDFNDQIVCSDTLYFSCPVEPDCLYLASDTIYCEDGLTVYDFTICNPNDNLFDIGYFTMNPSSPAGVTLSPPFFDLSADPLLPGTCRSFSVILSAPSLGGETFCYQLIGHETDPNVDPASLCCSLDTIYCIDIPFCDPCEFVSVVDVHESDMGCCYDVILDNQFDANYFDEIAVCVLSPQTTMTVNNPFGSGWTTNGFTGTSASFLPGAVFGNAVPLGVFSIPQICVETNIAPNQEIEIKWMRDGEVVCRDTIETACEPPCGYLLQESIECEPDAGVWNFSALLKNTSGVTMGEAHIHFNDPSLSAYDQVISLGSLAPDAIFSSINLSIGAPAMPGDSICFTVTLHEISADGVFLTCCNFEHCLLLPDCDFNFPCICDEAFFDAVNQGISCLINPGDPSDITFSLTDIQSFGECDLVIWSFADGTSLTDVPANTTVNHLFNTPGTYQVCAKVYRYDDNGVICKEKACKLVIITDNFTDNILTMYPNPSTGAFQVKINRAVEGIASLTVLDELQRPVHNSQLEGNFEKVTVEMNLSHLSKGMYLVKLQFEDKVVVERLIIR